MSAVFKITKGLVGIEAEHFSEPWVVSVKRQRIAVFDIEFFELNMQDRKLARALGLDMSKRSPFEDTTLLSHLAKLRNMKVDSLIKQHMKDDDPMASADADNVDLADTHSARARRFASASVKQVIEVEVPQFTKENGDVVDAKVLRMYSTPRRDSVLTIELSESNLSWLADAVVMEWDVEDAPWVRHPDEDVASLPELTSPHICRYKKKGENKVIISAWYRLATGAFKECSKSLGDYKSMDADTLARHVRSCESIVVKKYEAHNHADVADE